MIQTTEVSITYKGDGVQTSFPYPYPYRNSDDIVGYIINDVGYEKRITNNFKYDKISNIYQYPLAGDPLAAPYSIKLIRETPQQQNADLPGKLPFSLIEKSLDWIIMILQEIGSRCNSLWHIRNDCKLSETNARNSASAAAESEENAANSEKMAKKWAMSPVSPDGKEDEDSSTGKTQSSKIWAALSREYAGMSKFKLPIGYYKNVAEMKSSDTAIIDRPCVTLGYYEPNDGGGAVYIIRAKTDSDVDDGGSVLVLDNGNVAELMVDGAVNVKQFGAKGDRKTDDYDAITKALHFSYLKDNGSITDGMRWVKAVSAVYFPFGTYKISKTLKITEDRTHFVLDMSSCILFYTGTDYAIEVRRLRQSTIKIGDIYTDSGGGIHFVAARDKNGDQTDYYQYVKLYFNTIRAKTDCIFLENRVNGWGNECQVYGGRLQKGEYGIRTFQDSTDDINHWTFYNIGFEGVQVGCLLHSEPVNDGNWHSLSEHVFFQCRIEDSKIALQTEGSVQNCLWIDASFPHLDKFKFSDLTKVFKFITPWGEYYSDSFIPKNADFDDYYFAGNYHIESNDVFNTLSNSPDRGQAGKLEVSYLVENYYHIDYPQKGYVSQKYRVCQEFCVNRFNKQHRIAA